MAYVQPLKEPTLGKSQPGLTAWVRRHSLGAYFILALTVSWALWIPMATMGVVVGPGSRASHFPGLLGPMLAALLVTAVTEGRTGIRDLLVRMVRWQVGWQWWLVATLGPFALFALGAFIQAAIGAGWPNLSGLGGFGGVPLIGPLGVWAILVLVNGFGEETGWRGYAQERLQRTYHPIVASLLIAVPWALWHVPTFWVLETYRGLSPAVLPGFFLGLASGAVVYGWLYNRTGGSILMVALMHGSLNLASGTVAARGFIAAFVSMSVVVWGMALVLLQWRERRRRRPVAG